MEKMANIILLHGAYQGGWIWQRVSAVLRAGGHNVFAPTLDGCGERRHALRPGIDTESQAAEVAAMLFDGEAVSDHVQRPTAITTDLATGPSYEDASNRMFASLTGATKEWALARYTPHPVAAMAAPVKLDSFWQSSWNASVIYCKQAPNPGLAHQRRAADTLKAKWYELDTGHYPMLTEPEALSKLILTA